MNIVNRASWIIISLQTLTSFAFAQELHLSGKITDKKSGEPLYYATISVDHDKKIVASDFDGNYSLNVAWNDTIVVRHTGMKTQKIRVDTTVIHIELEEVEVLNVEFGPPIRPIKPPTGLTIPVTSSDLQQENIISGIIINKENNEIIAGAIIKNKKTGKIVHSATNGIFEIAASVNDIVEISYKGISCLEIKVTDKSDYKIYIKLSGIKKSKKQRRSERSAKNNAK